MSMALAAGWALAGLSLLHADDLQITVAVTAGERKAETRQTRQSPAPDPPAPREVFHAESGEPLSVRWQVTNHAQNTKFNDVLVHFFVAREEKTGQHAVPKLTKNVLYEGALTMDFAPKNSAQWQFDLNITAPGSYLLRVETIGLSQAYGHEYHAALDLVIK